MLREEESSGSHVEREESSDVVLLRGGAKPRNLKGEHTCSASEWKK